MKNESKENQIIYQTGKYVFAPVLNSFVLQVLTDAMNNGIKTLYFLARDAYFDYQIAKSYAKEFDLDIQCKYLYVSRLSLRIPLYHLDINQALAYITLSGVDVTPVKVINRAGLPEAERTQFVKKISDYLEVKEDEQIPRHRLPEVKELLGKDKAFINILIANSKKEFSNALNYLKEIGFGENEKIAIVDSGWVGSIQQSLNVFRKYLGVQEPLEGYYYGLYEIPPEAEECYYHSFLFGPRSGLRKKVEFNNCLFECIFSAPHGMTIGYKGDEEKNAPILSTISKSQIDFINQIENIIKDYQSDLVNKYAGFNEICELFNKPEAQKVIEKTLFNFMSKPSYEEAEVFGKLHFSDDVIDYNNAVLATPLTERDLVDNHFLRRVLLELREVICGKRYVVNISGWYEGSVMLYSEPSRIRHHLSAYNHYKYYLQYSKRKRWLKSVKKVKLRNSKPVDNSIIVEDLRDMDTVISVQNVTMTFRIATQNVSGIKDYFIQLLKRKITYREFNALDNVSFDVYKGEVVGIIGTNGSGKSTLLKIVSGALRPTAGNVKVDRRKVQLLTLGTGFDMELTGRENVYLNGAIIGYSKEFLDAHYDEIVAFAELEDFMDEKVKNYSSGMVSRLGFAIATAGDAAEILILDEVLSVGDEFFRKKSLARVKEMIHGGSTVLLVSHSMPTIKDNCSKVVWIEKGELRMVGKPEVVCKAYQQMNDTITSEPAQVSEVS